MQNVSSQARRPAYTTRSTLLSVEGYVGMPRGDGYQDAMRYWVTSHPNIFAFVLISISILGIPHNLKYTRGRV